MVNIALSTTMRNRRTGAIGMRVQVAGRKKDSWERFETSINMPISSWAAANEEDFRELTG